MSDKQSNGPTYTVQASHLKVGDDVIIRGHTCKITQILTSKPGKSGHVKLMITVVYEDGSIGGTLLVPHHMLKCGLDLIPIINY